jgi:glycosyltransferase involved in cell wall biosynthesis
MPNISVIMPVYGVERFVADAVESVLAQSFTDFELLIVDDMSPDNSMAICETFDDPRIRIIRHRENRGLAGARNTGIRHARGELLAFIDSDDCWRPDKLARHVEHLATCPQVGVSFSRSAFIDEENRPNHCYQMPRLTGIEPGYYLCRNPIGNGSAPVIRRAVFDAIGYEDDYHGIAEDWFFDERLRRSEDIECWIRIALTTDWQIEGIPEALTLYRLNAGGLSANLLQQFESWQQVIEKTRRYAPDFIAQWERTARAFQLRYLARQAIRLYDGRMAMQLTHRALGTDPRILLREPGRTLTTWCAACLLRLSPRHLYPALEQFAQRLIGGIQARRIGRDLQSRSA